MISITFMRVSDKHFMHVWRGLLDSAYPTSVPRRHILGICFAFKTNGGKKPPEYWPGALNLLPRWMQFPLSSEAALWAERPPIQHERPWTPKCSKGCLFCTPGSPKPLLSPTPPRPISTERTLAECSLKADLSLFKHFRAFYWWKSRVRSEGSRVCLRVDNLASLGEGVHENLASVAVYLKAPRRDSVRSAYKWLKFLKGY